MTRSTRPLGTFAVCLTLTLLSLGTALAQDGGDERVEQIVANLKHTYPELQSAAIALGPIEASEYQGLDQGTFSVDGRQTFRFLLSKDTTKLFLLRDTIDVSRSAEQIAAEVAEQEAARAAEFAAAIEGGPFRGGADAAVTIIEFSDFQCPYCQRGAQTVEEILAKYGDDVKFVFKHFPLDFHPWARPAAIASQCAGAQSPEAFWTLHDEYFRSQKQLTAENIAEKSKEFLASSDIDMAAWSACAEDTGSEEHKAVAAAVAGDMALGQRHGVTGTPGFFVNGTFLNGAQPLAAFEPLIDAALAAAEASD